MPPKFFITHSWKDIDFAKRLCNDLRANGLDGFFDAYTIQPGDSIPARIAKGLEECDVYVPMLSPDALASRWSELEINSAITLERTHGKPRIIPIIAKPCTVPVLLRATLYIDFTVNYDAALRDLLTKGFGVTPKPPATNAPELIEPDDPPIDLLKPTITIPRDELIHLYNDARALQSSGDLRAARFAFRQVVQAKPDYRDAAVRLQKLDLYLTADNAMQKSLADEDDKTEYWVDAATRLQELLKLDANFLDAPAKLQTAQHWLALAETYERLLDALDEDDWAKALPLIDQIRKVKQNYKKVQSLYDKVWGEFVRAGLNKKINERDGKEMIFIPAGEFMMDEEDKANRIYLDAFYISRYPVTNAEYKKFVDETKYQHPRHWQNGDIPNGKENHPVVQVSWNDAVAYCNWAGTRLPAEVEWDKTASWDQTRKMKRAFPWGNNFDVSKCNTFESVRNSTTPVDKYSPQGDSAYGVSDMVGNVWEWCADWYTDWYADWDSDGKMYRVVYNDEKKKRVLRGGSWGNLRGTTCSAMRDRFEPEARDNFSGFRYAESFPR